MFIFTALRNLGGWRCLAACFVAGLIMALGFAPYHFLPVIFICLPMFYLWLELATTRSQIVWRSFFFGYGYFMGGTWWIANSMLVDADKFAWMIPFSIIGLSAVMAVWFAVFGWLVGQWKGRLTIVHFALLWVFVEVLRSIGMFGFPWNLVGYMSFASLPLAQLASIIGTYGLSFLLLLVGLSPLLWRSANKQLAWILPLIVVGFMYGYGLMRLQTPEEITPTKLRLVQPAIPQSLKWAPEGREESLKVHADLTRRPGLKADAVIWAETALPFTLRTGSPWPSRLGTLLKPGQTLLTGSITGAEEEGRLKIWNSLVAIDPQGVIQDTYSKHQLVPFGEFVPLRDVLPLDKITPGDIDFSRGEGVRTVHVAGLPPYSPLICYEVIFPHLAVNEAERPDWILNVTNDGWYGDSPGPYQHFEMARMRAVEQGLPLVRVANTGISAVIDPYGRIISYLELNIRGVVDANLPAKTQPTFYGCFGSKFMLLLLLVILGFSVANKLSIRK